MKTAELTVTLTETVSYDDDKQNDADDRHYDADGHYGADDYYTLTTTTTVMVLVIIELTTLLQWYQISKRGASRKCALNGTQLIIINKPGHSLYLF